MSKGKASGDAAFIARAIRDFLNDHAPRLLTASDHTLKAYRDAITVYVRFLQECGVAPSELSRRHFERGMVERWVVWLKEERGNSPDTCNNRLASIRRFLEYLGSRDVSYQYLYVESRLIRRQRPAKTKVEGMSEAAVAAILAAPDASTAIGRRDLVFMTLMYSTATRLDEVRSLTAGQLHLDGARPYVTVVGKGRKARTLYLMPRVAALTKAYLLETLGPDPGPDSLLFPSRCGSGKMSEAAWDKRIKLHAASARRGCPEVPDVVHAHRLRHARATHWLDAGLNVVEVQHLLGHSQVETTMRYLDITMSEKAKALASLEGEGAPTVAKKWKTPDGTLLGFCGLSAGR